MTKFVVHVRKTIDWGSATLSTLDYFEKSFGSKQRQRLKYLIWLWDRSLTVGYLDYRARLKKIAERSWRDSVDHIFDYPSDHFLEVTKKLDDTAFVIPSDDDDWLSPQLRHIEIPSDVDFVFWNNVYIDWSSVQPWYRFHKSLCSNNFALRLGFLRSLPDDVALRAFPHETVLSVVGGRNAHQLHLKQPLSCYVIHNGCVHRLMTKCGKSPLEQFTRRYRFPKLSNQTEWVRPYAFELISLINSVKIRDDLPRLML